MGNTSLRSRACSKEERGTKMSQLLTTLHLQHQIFHVALERKLNRFHVPRMCSRNLTPLLGSKEEN